jgi:hypothetical protein
MSKELLRTRPQKLGPAIEGAPTDVVVPGVVGGSGGAAVEFAFDDDAVGSDTASVDFGAVEGRVRAVQDVCSRTAVLQCETTFHIETRAHFDYNLGRVKGNSFRPAAAASGPGNRGAWQSGAASCYDFPRRTGAGSGTKSPAETWPAPSCKCPGVSVAYPMLFRAGPAEGHNRNSSSSKSIRRGEHER